MNSGMKRCTRCGKEKPLTRFYFVKARNLHMSRCKDCCADHQRAYHAKNKEVIVAKRRAYYAKNKTKISSRHKAWAKKNAVTIKDKRLQSIFGITLEDYERMVKDQHGKCAICGSKEAWPGELSKHFRPRTWCVDHNHRTLKVRGLLCNRCNTALGMVDDSIEVLSMAIEYLRKNTE